MLAHSGKHEHEASQQPGQRERRQPLISRLPRQADMDDSCTTPLVEPRKSRGTPSTPVPPVVKGQPPHTDEFSCDMTISPEQPQANTSFSSPPRTGDPSEEESIALARQLMAQEALESYAAFSSDYLRYNTAQYSQEDLEALHAALDDDIDEQVGGESNGEQYEIMLRLGEAIGDVKNERWKMVSDQYISLLPTFEFDHEAVKQLDENDSRRKCLVCQFVYEDGEHLRTLPCGHCFHADCVDQWLKDKDCCAYCRQPIVQG
ncbi:RING-H2 zinc finger domain [Fragilaria crotonensis]|nr:RING-H2 zinc finger domain [Fragilaria crotonensis]